MEFCCGDEFNFKLGGEMSFQYNLYVGDHMKDPLIVKYSNGCVNHKTELNGFVSNRIGQHPLFDDISCFGGQDEICTPIIKPLDTLTDEDILFIFECKGLDVKIKRGANSIRIFCRNGFSSDYSMEIYQINFFTKTSKNINQKILDNLYSLHRSPDEKALEEKGLVIVDREGVYYG